VMDGMNARLRYYNIVNKRIFWKFVPFSLLVGWRFDKQRHDFDKILLNSVQSTADVEVLMTVLADVRTQGYSPLSSISRE
jgi:hypothetical protein